MRMAGVVAFGIRIYGRENLPDSGGVILASNHQSFFDPALLALGSNRQLRFFARRTLFKNPMFAGLIRFSGAIEFGRDGVDTAGIRNMVDLLKQGEMMVMFPEGTRTHDGSIGKVKPGVGMIARRADVPVVPAVIDGAFRAWPRSKRFPRPWKLNVAFGEPISPGEYKGRKMQTKLQDSLKELLQFLRNKQ